MFNDRMGMANQICGTLLLAAAALHPVAASADAEMARGTVFHDLNGNGVLDEGEPPIAGVPISNGLDVVLTDEEGRWELPIEGDTVIFMTKPSGYAIDTKERLTPRFHYIHRPEGSPDLHFAGIEPTGPLPESINFPLRRVDEPEEFRVVLFADPQPMGGDELDYLLRTTIGEVRNTANADFGITLGDILFDYLNFFDPYIEATARIGIPFYGVIGNHDLNFDSPDDFYAGETYIRHYGPRTYSFNVGKVHFVCMDNIIYEGGTPEEHGRYREAFRESDMEWLRNNLEHVPDDYLVVIATHSPIWMAGRSSDGRFIEGTDMLFDVLRERQRILAVNGHSHYTTSRFFGPEDGWEGEGGFHQMNIVTVSGGWWGGPEDLSGIPMTPQRDGTPHGYVLVDFEGSSYTPHYKAIGRPADHQMRIYVPLEVEDSDPPRHRILVNVFDGMMDHGRVSFRFNDSDWRPMRFAPQRDPVAEAHYHEDAPNRKWFVNPTVSQHMWEAELDEGELRYGSNFVEVIYTDILGREFNEFLAFYHYW